MHVIRLYTTTHSLLGCSCPSSLPNLSSVSNLVDTLCHAENSSMEGRQTNYQFQSSFATDALTSYHQHHQNIPKRPDGFHSSLAGLVGPEMGIVLQKLHKSAMQASKPSKHSAQLRDNEGSRDNDSTRAHNPLPDARLRRELADLCLNTAEPAPSGKRPKCLHPCFRLHKSR